MRGLTLPTSILRDTNAFWGFVKEYKDLGRLATTLFLVSCLFLSVYGAIMGVHGITHGRWEYILASAIKLPVLFLVTLAICLPALHIVQILLGSRQSLSQHAVLLLATTAVASTLLVAFAPITAFFSMTTKEYFFMKLLNVAAIGIAACFAMSFFSKGMRVISATGEEGGQSDSSRAFVQVWILMYGFVGSQLAWTLRPFVGDPDKNFTMFREFGGNFYVNVLDAVGKMFGF